MLADTPKNCVGHHSIYLYSVDLWVQYSTFIYSLNLYVLPLLGTFTYIGPPQNVYFILNEGRRIFSVSWCWGYHSTCLYSLDLCVLHSS